jgi:VanZ family protein
MAPQHPAGRDGFAATRQFACDSRRRKAASQPEGPALLRLYTWLALLAFLTIKRRSLAVMAALSMILLGVALEFGQKLIPGRSFEVRDMFINGAGVLIGLAIGILSRRILPAVSSS